MKNKAMTPGAGSAKRRLQWRPANALSVGATSRASWSKTGKKRGKNPRGKMAKSRT
jgi:hypothetical protein